MAGHTLSSLRIITKVWGEAWRAALCRTDGTAQPLSLQPKKGDPEPTVVYTPGHSRALIWARQEAFAPWLPRAPHWLLRRALLFCLRGCGSQSFVFPPPGRTTDTGECKRPSMGWAGRHQVAGHKLYYPHWETNKSILLKEIFIHYLKAFSFHVCIV